MTSSVTVLAEAPLYPILQIFHQKHRMRQPRCASCETFANCAAVPVKHNDGLARKLSKELRELLQDVFTCEPSHGGNEVEVAQSGARCGSRVAFRLRKRSYVVEEAPTWVFPDPDDFGESMDRPVSAPKLTKVKRRKAQKVVPAARRGHLLEDFQCDVPTANRSTRKQGGQQHSGDAGCRDNPPRDR